MYKHVLSLFTAIAIIAGAAASLRAQPAAPVAATPGIALQASGCDRKCQGKKMGDKQSKLHRPGWEAAIRQLGVTGAQRQQLLDASSQIEEQIRRAYSALSRSEIQRVRKEADAVLMKLVSDRYTLFKDGAFRGRHDHIAKETGVPPWLDQKP